MGVVARPPGPAELGTPTTARPRSGSPAPPKQLPGDADFAATERTPTAAGVRAGLAGLPLRRRALLGRPARRRSTPRSTAAIRWTRPLGPSSADRPGQLDRRLADYLVRARPALMMPPDPDRHQRLPAPDRGDRVVRRRCRHPARRTTSSSTRRAARRGPDRPRPAFPVVRGRLRCCCRPRPSARRAQLICSADSARPGWSSGRRPRSDCWPRPSAGPGRSGSSG